MSTTSRVHYFRDENDDRTVVRTTMTPAGGYVATVIDGLHSEHRVRGHGHSRLAAVANLYGAIASAEHHFIKDGGEL